MNPIIQEYLPQIRKLLAKDYLFVYDVECDGFSGEGYAVGAIVYDLTVGNVIDTFSGKTELYSVQSEWAKENALPVMADLPIFTSRMSLRTGFWDFYLKYKDNSVIVADYAGIIDSHWFRQCVEDELLERDGKSPAIIHEVGTAIMLSGENVFIKREIYSGVNNLRKHHPVDDSILSAICFLKAMIKVLFNKG